MLGEYLGAGSGTTKGLYHLNGNSNDDSGNSNNGVGTNVTWVGGKLGSGSASVAGASKIDLPTGTRLGGAFTIAIYLKPTNISGGTGTEVIYNDWGASSRNIQIYQAYQNISILSGNGSTGNDSLLQTSNILTTTDYHSIIFTRNGTTVSIYHNGVLSTTNTGSYSGGTTSNPLLLFADAPAMNAGYCYKGLADEVIIENRAWTAEEVRKHYTYSRGKYAIL